MTIDDQHRPAAEGPDDGRGRRDGSERAGRGLSGPAVVVLVLGLAITAALALLAATDNNRNEDRLLGVQVHEAGTVLAGAVPTVELPLTSGVAIATVSDQTGPFTAFMAAYVNGGRPFASVVLCHVVHGVPTPVATVGTPAAGAGGPAQCRFLATPRPGQFSVAGIVAGGTRLGYSFTSAADPGVGAYAETLLPPHRRVALPRGSSFSNLSFALYLGRSARQSALIETTAAHLPLSGRQAATTVPFGNTAITIVGSPTQPLGGALSRDLATIVGLLGVVLTIGAAAMTERLVRRRRLAEALARENRRLYAEQRSLAATMQEALLPMEMPTIEGVEVGARYVAGHDAMQIGGDWFDVIPRGRGEFLFVVGDVSGRGVSAATVMASLHYAIRAYALEGHDPSTILSKLGTVLDMNRHGHFATVLCGSVDTRRHRLTLASAGHFAPLVLQDGSGTYVPLEVGVPIGVSADEKYASADSELPAGATLLAFTDGLIERRGETLDQGLSRLKGISAPFSGTLEELLSEVVLRATPAGSDDDTALLGLRWRS